MYAFWRHALFVRGQSFSVKNFDRSCNGCQVMRLGAGDDFRGPSGQALPLPSRVSLSRAVFLFCFFAPTTSKRLNQLELTVNASIHWTTSVNANIRV